VAARTPPFFALAATVGFSRVYVGAHNRGDVTSGALAGLGLSMLFRQAFRRFVL
jgi:membrane-associated phospholipid phosphatase